MHSLLVFSVFLLTAVISLFAIQAQANELSTLQHAGIVQSQQQSSLREHDEIKVSDSYKAGEKSRLDTFFSDAKYLITSPARMDKQDALILGGVAAGFGGLMLLDEEIRDFAQKNRSETGDDIAKALEDIGSAPAVFAGNFVLLGTGWWFREEVAGEKLYETAWISLEAQIFTETIAGFTKIAVGRSRPNQDNSAYAFNPFSSLTFDRSFPSSHAARSFAVASVFADHYEHPVPAIAYTAASLVSLSRIYLNEHWTSDVFAGAVLGFAIGKALSWRHRHKDQNITFLPGVDGNMGLTLLYSF